MVNEYANKVVRNIIGNPRQRGGPNDLDGDGVPNRKDCQPRNTMRQDAIDSDAQLKRLQSNLGRRY